MREPEQWTWIESVGYYLFYVLVIGAVWLILGLVADVVLEPVGALLRALF